MEQSKISEEQADQRREREALRIGAAEKAFSTQRAASPQVPSVGRVVHYVAYGTPGGEFPVGEHRAAIITEVDPSIAPPGTSIEDWQAHVGGPHVGLCVMNPQGLFFNRHCPYNAAGKEGGTWHRPEYVPAR